MKYYFSTPLDGGRMLLSPIVTFFKGETFDEMEKIPLGAISVLCGAIFVGAHFTLLSDFFKKGSV